jgi:hypothetical protein
MGVGAADVPAPVGDPGLGARALARRNGAREGKPVNQVLAAAITATEARAACQQPPDPTTKPAPEAGEAEGHPS